jgi:hypothetical protein
MINDWLFISTMISEKEMQMFKRIHSQVIVKLQVKYQVKPRSTKTNRRMNCSKNVKLKTWKIKHIQITMCERNDYPMKIKKVSLL